LKEFKLSWYEQVIGQTIFHYSNFQEPLQERDRGKPDKILEKLGEVPKLPARAFLRIGAMLRIAVKRSARRSELL
jgi:hypothetical protein